MAGARYTKVIKLVREAEDLARSGALVLNDGAAAIYFLWGQPTHAYLDREDGERLEGEPALKEIALSLAHPGKVTWRTRDVISTETLRGNAEDLVAVLEAMASSASSRAGKPTALPRAQPTLPQAASSDSWDGSERRRGPALRYSLNEFPLLPSGPTLWADVPTSVVHLDVLIGTLQNVMVVFEAPAIRAVGVVADGERYDAIYIDQSGVRQGRVAWELMIVQGEGTVSAYEIEPDVARTLPVLWRNRIVHRDLDNTWINRSQFLSAQRGDEEDRAIIVATPDAIGIALFAQGRPVACYSTVSRMPTSSTAEIEALLALDDEGHVTVLERDGEDIGEAYVGRIPDESPVDEDEDVRAVAESFAFQPIDDTFAPVDTRSLPPVEPLNVAALLADESGADLQFSSIDPTDTPDSTETPAMDPYAESSDSADAAEADDAQPSGAVSADAADTDAADTDGAESSGFSIPDTASPSDADSGDVAEAATSADASAGGDDVAPDADVEAPDADAITDAPTAPDSAPEDAATDSDTATSLDSGDDASDADDDASADEPSVPPEPPAPDAPTGDAALLAAPSAPHEYAPISAFASAPSGVGLGDFASMLSGPAPGAPLVSAPSAPPPSMADPFQAFAVSAAASAAAPPPVEAAPPEPPPPPPDWDTVVGELLHIIERFVPADNQALIDIITAAPQTPSGLRAAIGAVRRTDIPSLSADQVTSMARAMTLYVADRVSAM